MSLYVLEFEWCSHELHYRKNIVEIQQREAIQNCEGAAYRKRDLIRKQWEELVDIFGKEDMIGSKNK